MASVCIQGYRDELCPPSCIPRAGSFRIPLFTRSVLDYHLDWPLQWVCVVRSESFKSVDYQVPSTKGETLDGGSRAVSFRFQREAVRASFEFFRKGAASPGLLHLMHSILNINDHLSASSRLNSTISTSSPSSTRETWCQAEEEGRD